MTGRIVSLTALALILVATVGLLCVPSFASKRAPTPRPKIFAQKLVDEVASKHPDVTGVELSVRSSTGCSTIAASDPKDIGEKCDKDELEPMRTGQPSVEKEGKEFDVTMPLHDTSGQIIGTVGLDIKAEPGQHKASAIERAKKIVQEFEAQIQSTAMLLEPVD
jgi:hypothetical protein